MEGIKMVSVIEKRIFSEIIEQICSLDFSQISVERKKNLDQLTEELSKKVNQKEPLILQFIGTDNTYRTIYAQIWSTVIAAYLGIELKSFSGGFKELPINHEVLELLAFQGFKIIEKSGSSGSIFFILFSEDADPITIYSKKVNDPINPPNGFLGIVMTTKFDEIKEADKYFKYYQSYVNQRPKPKGKKGWSKDIPAEMYYVLNNL